jgi:hypothetical protein
MLRVNTSIQNTKGAEYRKVEPHEIFELVAGTSTGGLIAIMLGKLGMTVDECIHAYRSLSSVIFRKKHIRGRITRGLAPSRYSGSRMRAHVRDLIQERSLMDGRPVGELSMSSDINNDKIAW